MKNKKYLAFFCDFTVEENFNQFLVGSEFLINKFVEEFGNEIEVSLFKNVDKFLKQAYLIPPDVIGLSVGSTQMRNIIE